MRPEQRDPGYVWDMLDAARSTREFTKGVTDEYLRDRKLQLAIERVLEIIGDAARFVSPTFKTNHGGLPWKEIIGQVPWVATDATVVVHNPSTLAQRYDGRREPEHRD